MFCEKKPQNIPYTNSMDAFLDMYVNDTTSKLSWRYFFVFLYHIKRRAHLKTRTLQYSEFFITDSPDKQLKNSNEIPNNAR